MLRGILDEISLVAKMLFEKGWAEGNAGNISVNISDIPEKEKAHFAIYDKEYPLPHEYSRLAGHLFLITRTGGKMPELCENPSEHLAVMKISANGKYFNYLDWDGIPPQRLPVPSSELPSHLAIHEYLVTASRPEKAILHTHVNELIALTHDPDISNEQELNAILMPIHPEVVMFFPEGIGLVPFMRPGSQEIGVATAESCKKHKVMLWEKHGAISIGKDVTTCFDQIEIINKAAKIYLLCRAAGFKPTGLTEEQMKMLHG